MNNILKKIVVGSLITGSIWGVSNVSLANANYEDTERHWAKSHIEFMSETKLDKESNETKIISGYPDNTFRPDNQVTRAEVSKIIVEYGFVFSDKDLFGQEVEAPQFADIDANDPILNWSNIEYSTNENIKYLSGYEDNTFRPSEGMTRGEFSKVVYNYLEKEGLIENKEVDTNKLTDIEGYWGEKEIRQLEAMGTVKGYKDGTFKPTNPITRAEVVTILATIGGAPALVPMPEIIEEVPAEGNQETKPVEKEEEFSFINPSSGILTSPFGPRWGKFHKGIDIGAPTGTPIFAAEAGVVTYSAYDKSGYGNLMVIDHGNGYVTKYAHNNANIAKVGGKVYKGEMIGTIGNTGRSTGPHLHFEVIQNGVNLNPQNFVRY